MSSEKLQGLFPDESEAHLGDDRIALMQEMPHQDNV
jgi:hypothetical protein